MIKKYTLKFFLYVIICLALCSCSQDPGDPDEPTGIVSGTVERNLNVFSSDIFVRAFEYVDGSYDSSEEPVNKAKIESDGTYSLALPTGSYVLELFSNNVGFSNVVYPDTFNSSCNKYKIVVREDLGNSVNGDLIKSIDIECNPGIIDITEGSDISSLDFDISKTGSAGTIYGKVSNDGNPVEGLTIIAETSDTKYGECKSQPDGTYTLCCLPTKLNDSSNVTYQISVLAEDTKYISSQQNTNLSADDIKELDFVISKGVEITGKIIRSEDDSFQNVGGIDVCARKGIYSICTTSSSDGSYTIVGLESGSYNIDILTQYPYYATARDVDVDVTVLGTYDEIEIKLGSIEINLLNEDYEFIEKDLEVYIYENDSDELVWKGRTGEVSSYEIKRLPGGNDGEYGEYKLEILPVYEDDYEYSEDEIIYAPQFYNDDNKEGATPIDVSNNKNTIDLHLKEGGEIEGRIQDYYSNDDLKDVNVTLHYSSKTLAQPKLNKNWNSTVKTDEDGKFSIPGLADGYYGIEIQPNDVQYYPGFLYIVSGSRVSLKSGINSATSIEINDDQDHVNIENYKNDNDIIYLKTPGTISGIIDDYYRGCEGIFLYAENEEGTYSASTTTESDGSYTILQLPPDRYKMYLDIKDKDYRINTAINGGSNIYDKDTVTKDFYVAMDTGYEIDINLELIGGWIQGQVTCPSGDIQDYIIKGLETGDYLVSLETVFGETVSLKKSIDVTKGLIEEGKNLKYFIEE